MHNIVLGEDGKKLDVYLPAATWYDWYTQNSVTDTGMTTITVDTPLDMMPVSVIITLQYCLASDNLFM